MRNNGHIYDLDKGHTKSTWIPSAAYAPTHGGITIYVRYHAMMDNPRITIRTNSNSYVWIDTPDRELVFVNGAHTVGSYRPLDENYDEAIILSPFHECMRDMGIENVMTNYPQHLQRKDLCLHHRKEGFRPNGVRYMADSGGFQLMSGRIDYIDPVKLTEWYNTNTDYGVALDLPILVDNKELLDRTALIQKDNLRRMLEVKAPHVQLLNVIHGSTIDQQVDFHKKVEHPDIDLLCVADVYHGDILSTLARVLGIIWGIDRPYKLYHMLGVYNLGIMPFLIKASADGLIPNALSFDSSTHIQSARTRMYHHQRMPNRPPERMIIGMENPSCSRPNPFKHLPCSCPVCQTIKYMDIFSILPGAVTTYLLMIHNMYEINRYASMMNYYAHTLTDTQFSELMISSAPVPMSFNGGSVQIEGQLGNHNAKKSVKGIMDFISRLKDKASDEQRYKIAKDHSGENSSFSILKKKEFIGSRELIDDVSEELGIEQIGAHYKTDGEDVKYFDLEGNDRSLDMDDSQERRSNLLKVANKIITSYEDHEGNKHLSGKKSKDASKKKGGSMYNKVASNRIKKSKLKRRIKDAKPA